MDVFAAHQQRYERLFPELNERQRRLLAAADAQALGHGGIVLVHRASLLAVKTIRKGIKELKEDSHLAPGRCRAPGSGRKSLLDHDPTLHDDLLSIVTPVVRGDPMSPLLWVAKSTRKLQTALEESGHTVSHETIRTILVRDGFTQQSNVKSHEDYGTKMNEEERDAQFQYIANTASAFLQAGDPVISTDTKKKELVGNYENDGTQWLPSGQPVEVNSHDFGDRDKQGKVKRAIPYGVFDVGKNEGYVTVGITHDTAEFAVSSIQKWWTNLGREKYPEAKRLLITVDAGGSNGYRVKLWKLQLQKFAKKNGMELTICHFPRGKSKWNAIEHKLFSFISLNWKGQPLRTYSTVVSLIAATTTQKGLKVYAALDKKKYVTRQEVTKEQMAQLNIHPHTFRPELNYSILPQSKKN